MFFWMKTTQKSLGLRIPEDKKGTVAKSDRPSKPTKSQRKWYAQSSDFRDGTWERKLWAGLGFKQQPVATEQMIRSYAENKLAPAEGDKLFIERIAPYPSAVKRLREIEKEMVAAATKPLAKRRSSVHMNYRPGII